MADLEDRVVVDSFTVAQNENGTFVVAQVRLTCDGSTRVVAFPLSLEQRTPPGDDDTEDLADAVADAVEVIVREVVAFLECEDE